MRVFDDFGRDVSELMVPSSTTNYSSIFDSKAENLEATLLSLQAVPSSSGRKEHKRWADHLSNNNSNYEDEERNILG